MTETQYPGGTVFSGAHGPYHWLTSTERYIGHLVELCPDVIVGRYLAVTAIDGGSPWLTDAQREAGWELRSGIAYSQRISAAAELFYQRDGDDRPGYDEWYLFDEPPTHLGEVLKGNPFEEDNKPRPGRLLVFVNWVGFFVLHDPHPSVQTITGMFWRQLEWVQPDIYVSDGKESLTFVCRHEALFNSVHQRLSEALKRSES